MAHDWLTLRAVLAIVALDGRRSADESTNFTVPGNEPIDSSVLPVVGRFIERVLNDGFVFVAVLPYVAVRVEVRWLPSGNDVPVRMPVEVDQSGQDHAIGVQDLHSSRFV